MSLKIIYNDIYRLLAEISLINAEKELDSWIKTAKQRK